MATDKQAVSVLFVCLGNICRSPMAEGVFRHLTSNLPSSSARPHPRISEIDSAGTGAYHVGSPPDERTISVLESNGIMDYLHAARKFSAPRDFESFDYIFAMDEDNREHLERLRQRLMKQRGSVDGEKLGKVMLFGEFGGKGEEQVIDPYYGARDGFTVAYEQMNRFSRGFLASLER